MTGVKLEIISFFGIIGSYIAGLFGGWSTAMTTLLIFMAIDYITGLLVAGIFHASNKTKNGSLESNAGFKGLCRKGVALLIVLVGSRLDLIVGTSHIKDAVVIAFVVNEVISITENAGLMGVPMPECIVKAIEILQDKDTDIEA